MLLQIPALQCLHQPKDTAADILLLSLAAPSRPLQIRASLITCQSMLPGSYSSGTAWRSQPLLTAGLNPVIC